MKGRVRRWRWLVCPLHGRGRHFPNTRRCSSCRSSAASRIRHGLSPTRPHVGRGVDLGEERELVTKSLGYHRQMVKALETVETVFRGGNNREG